MVHLLPPSIGGRKIMKFRQVERPLAWFRKTKFPFKQFLTIYCGRFTKNYFRTVPWNKLNSFYLSNLRYNLRLLNGLQFKFWHFDNACAIFGVNFAEGSVSNSTCCFVNSLQINLPAIILSVEVGRSRRPFLPPAVLGSPPRVSAKWCRMGRPSARRRTPFWLSRSIAGRWGRIAFLLG